ncbi:hypothetical protein B0T19DRAFT_139789 [Cercophora scortea]|uniref:Cytoplasmic tRNA 2-thiolation protein 2 n=1 Tax=Cercophora scortea TaxID=314031 RepID=A0AAE0J0G6_9PEZI|nr:hypothetical protein B0T19DRAFT_139789 [Cercophora scortea]
MASETPPVAPRRCTKCRVQEATLDSRSQAVCGDCFAKHVSTKCIKQIATLGKETRSPLGPSTGTGPPPTARRGYLLGLSLGVSSTVLVDLLNDNVDFQLSRGRAAPFDLVAVHVDASPLTTNTQQTTTTAAEETLESYRARYPRFTFLCIPLTSALTLPTIDWSTLPALDKTQPADVQLQSLFAALPSTTARADMQRILTRHVLIAAARAHDCSTLLLGHSTTALAELTLAEAAKGRGFALPWQINDGAYAVVDYPPSSPSPSPSTSTTPTTILIHHPLRDLLRKELATYASHLTTPPLTDLIPPTADLSNAPVVSHKDLTIEEVMLRYFADVEENYPSVVANVARTTGKLVRIGAEARCGVCSMPLDEQGDERWRGELGDPVLREGVAGRLCYGCERSTRG